MTINLVSLLSWWGANSSNPSTASDTFLTLDGAVVQPWRPVHLIHVVKTNTKESTVDMVEKEPSLPPYPPRRRYLPPPPSPPAFTLEQSSGAPQPPSWADLIC